MPFSVLMSVYIKEKPEYLCESVKSVFSQTLPPDEVIIVEDGPLTDALYSALTDLKDIYPAIKIIKLPVNSGLGIALNEGLKYCSHELVARMDTDDLCFPDRFEKQIGFMSSHPEIAASSGSIEEFEDDISNVISVKKVPSTYAEIAEFIKYRNPLNHPAVMFRKSAVVAAGGYQHFPLFEDWYLWSRMFVTGNKLANLQDRLLHFRTSPQMFKRRGGWRYAKDSARFQWTLHKLGLISSMEAIKASVMRGGVYLMPNKLRSIIYNKILRN